MSNAPENFTNLMNCIRTEECKKAFNLTFEYTEKFFTIFCKSFEEFKGLKLGRLTKLPITAIQAMEQLDSEEVKDKLFDKTNQD